MIHEIEYPPENEWPFRLGELLQYEGESSRVRYCWKDGAGRWRVSGIGYAWGCSPFADDPKLARVEEGRAA